MTFVQWEDYDVLERTWGCVIEFEDVLLQIKKQRDCSIALELADLLSDTTVTTYTFKQCSKNLADFKVVSA